MFSSLFFKFASRMELEKDSKKGKCTKSLLEKNKVSVVQFMFINSRANDFCILCGKQLKLRFFKWFRDEETSESHLGI